MDSVTLMVDAMALGASASTAPDAPAEVRSAYARMRDLAESRYRDVGLSLARLEAVPDSPSRRADVAQIITQTTAGRDEELWACLRELLTALRDHDAEAFRATGVVIDDLDAARLKISDIAVEGVGATGVAVSGARIAGDVDIAGVRASGQAAKAVGVGGEGAGGMPQIRILFLAADATDTTRLRLGAESRAIDEALRKAEHRDRFVLAQHWAVRADDLQGLLLRHRPDIVHFSGHGQRDGAILLEDEAGLARPVAAEPLRRLFEILAGQVRCVVLNACFSATQAEAIARHVDCVIGMSEAVGDEAAIRFAATFYEAIGYGCDVETAFKLGCNRILLAGLGGVDTPQLLAPGVVASRVVFASEGSPVGPAGGRAGAASPIGAVLEDIRAGGNVAVHIGDQHIHISEAGSARESSGRPAGGATAVPFLVPHRPTRFVGRDAELAWLELHLLPPAVIAVTGPAGIGKSALALHAVWRLYEAGALLARFPGGVVCCRIGADHGPEAVLEQLAAAFGEEVDHGDAEAAARRALSAKRALVILDGTEAVPPEALQRLLDVAAPCAVLLTSRRRAEADAEDLVVGALPDAEARRMLVGWIGREDDAAALHAISQRLDGWPLAIRLAGRYLAVTGGPAAEYAEWLDQNPFETLDEVMAAPRSDRLGAAGLILRRSIEVTSDDARRVLQVVGALAPEAIPGDAVEETLGLNPVWVGRALGELAGYGILAGHQGLYDVAHGLIHDYLRRYMRLDDAAQARLAAYLSGVVEAQAARGREGHNALKAVRRHVLPVVEGCVQRQQWPEAMRLAAATYDYLDYRARYAEMIELSGLAIDAARGAGDRKQEAVWLVRMAKPFDLQHQSQEAITCLESASALAREVGSTALECSCLGNLGLAYHGMHDYGRAIDYYKQALALIDEDPRRQGDLENNLGLAYTQTGELDRAETHFRGGIALAKASGYQRGESHRTGNLGIALLSAQRTTDAIACFESALALAREIGDVSYDVLWLTHLARAWRAAGDTQAATRYYTEALETEVRVGDGHELAGLIEEAAAFFEECGDQASAARWRAELPLLNDTGGH